MEIKTANSKCDNSFIKNSLTFVEVVRPERVVALSKLKDFVTKEKRNDHWNDTCNNLSEIYGKAVSELSMIEDIIEKMKYDEDLKRWTITTKYFSKKTIGRVYAEYGSIGTMRRVFRHFVSEDIYYDIDIKNCHPTLLYNMCQAWQIPCDFLTQWVQDRDTVIKKIMRSGFTKCQSKRLISAIINGSTVEGYMKKNDIKFKCIKIKRKETGKTAVKPVKLTKFVDAFINEIKNIHKMIINHNDETKELYNQITEGVKFNKAGKFISMYLQMNEMMILEFALDFTVEYGITDRVGFEGVSIHDGFQILKSAFEHKSLDVYLHHLNGAVKEEFGFEIEFVEKPFDEAGEVKEQLLKLGYVCPESYECPFYQKYGVYKKTKYNTDDEFLSSLFINGNSEDFVTCNNNIYYLDGNGLFKEISNEYFNKKFSEYMNDFTDYCEKKINECHTNGQTVVNQMVDKSGLEKLINKSKESFTDDQIKYLIKELAFSKKERMDCLKLFRGNDNMKNDTKSKCFNKIKNKSSRQAIVDDVKQKLVDDNFYDLLDKNHDLLGFNNGILDLNTFEFRKAKKGEYVNMSCGYDWFYNEEYPDEVIEASEKMFNVILDMFANKQDCEAVLEIKSRCLKGNGNEDEIALFEKGTGGNGKSLLSKMMAVAYGEYYTPLTYNVFINESRDNRSQDLADCYLKRYVEVQEPSAEFVFKSDIFKRFTGGDEVTTKGNYHRGKSLRFVMGCLHFCSNHFITFDKETKEDCLRRRVVGVYLPKTFFKEGHPDYDPNNPNHKIRDESLKKQLESNIVLRQGIMILLLKYYKRYKQHGITITDNMKKATEDYFKNMSDGATLFNTMLEKTGKADDKIILSSKDGNGLRELFLTENNTENFSTTKFNKFIKKEFGDSSVGVGMLGYNAHDLYKIQIEKKKKKDVSKSKGRVLIGYKYKDEYLKKTFDDDDSECDSFINDLDM